MPKTAFSVENGQYEFLTMLSDLKNAPYTKVQRNMDNLMLVRQDKTVTYICDFVILFAIIQEHMSNLQDVCKTKNST